MLSSIADKLTDLLFVLPCVLIALTFHEYAHGWMAYKLGDPTAYNQGRLTLNPLKHLDPIGAICMVLFHFGWAKPVPINVRYFKHHKRDTALTAAAGPVMNFLLGFLGLLIYRILYATLGAIEYTTQFGYYLAYAALTLAYYFHVLNLSLGLFNLIPIPPLDGSRIFLIWLPAKYYFLVMKYERYIQMILLLLLWTNIITVPMSSAVQFVSGIMGKIISFLPFL